MEKKKWVKLAGFAMVVLLSLFVLTGCAENNVGNNTGEDKLVTVGFYADDESSRQIGLCIEPISGYSPEDMYWTFTARKLDGLYSEGATTEVDADGNLKEVPVGNAATDKGLAGRYRKFSTGTWLFSIYGYKEAAHTNKMLSGRVRVNLTTSKNVAFEMKKEGTFPTTGNLDWSGVARTTVLPPDMAVSDASKVKVEIKESSTVLASCTSTATGAKSGGATLSFGAFSATSKTGLTAGKHTLTFNLLENTTVKKTFTLPVFIVAGSVTKLTGDLCVF